jgi:ubiquinol-cytochrome c reductase cytochrome b subunit
MQGRVHQVVDWIEHRTGFQSACHRFLFEDIPASTGWPQVFGSIALFIFLTQALTGILLALNYAPTPGDAYKSVLFITDRVAAGRMIQGLHHWGASLMIIIVFLHMAQVFIYGAYRKPREATWMAGVTLLLFTLAFGLTGYLLPWDNRAYWGTVVTTRIAASVPLMGDFLTRLIGATDGIGVLTFSRFYALHTLVLPATTVLLITIHVYLVRRHGITASAADRETTQRFYPKQVFRDITAVFIVFLILFAAAVFVRVPLERLADPTDTSYVPRPEWYFLFLFQLLKIFQGSLEPIGTVVLPTVAVLTLFLLPFIRHSRLQILQRRAVGTGIVAIVFAVWGSLTMAAVADSPHLKHPLALSHEVMEWAQFPPEEIAGIGYFRSSHCDSCHNLLSGVPKPGPNLTSVQQHHPKAWLIQHFKDPGSGVSGNSAQPTHLSVLQLNALALFIANLKPDSVGALQTVPPEIIKGAQIYVAGGCGSCHKVSGVGGGIGPPLNGLSDRRTRSWIEAHFLSPQRLSPGSIMPVYRFSQAEENAIILYLFSLPE